jgi:hypothetical protein
MAASRLIANASQNDPLQYIDFAQSRRSPAGKRKFNCLVH